MPANTGKVDSSVPSGLVEYLYAKLNTQQAANLAANDHVKFDTVIASRTPGENIKLDTTTAYVTTTGAAAIGRLTLKAGRTYHLRAVLGYLLFSGITGLAELAFWNATANTEIPGVRSFANAASSAANEFGNGDVETIFSPSVDTLVEVRIVTATVLTQIGTTGARTPSLFVETDV